MTQRGRVVWGILAAALVGLVALWMQASGPQPARPRERVDAVPVRPRDGDLDRGERARVEPAATAMASSVVVRSRNGVPLRRARWSNLDGTEEWRNAREGVVRFPRVSSDGFIDAPGFARAAVGTDDATIELDAISSVVLAMRGVGAAVETVDVLPWMRLQPGATEVWLTQGAIGADAWGCAFDPAHVREAHGVQALECDLVLRTREVLQLTRVFDGERQAEARLDWTLASGTPLRDLELRIAGSAPADASVRVELWSLAPSAERLRHSAHYPWGSVSLLRPSLAETASITHASDGFAFERIPAGADYGAAAIGEGFYGRILFTHTGEARTLPLHLGTSILGVLRIDGRAAHRADFVLWPGAEDATASNDADAAAWRHELRDVVVDGDGAFAVALPQHVPHFAAASFPMPSRWTLEVRADGANPAIRSLVLAPGATLELGVVELAGAVVLEIVGDHGLAPERVQERVVLLDCGGGTARGAVRSAERRADGALILGCHESWKLLVSAEGRSLWPPVPLEERPERDARRMVLDLGGGELHAFERGAGVWRPVPSTRVELVVKNERGAGSPAVAFGWIHEGLRVPLGEVSTGATANVKTRVPSAGAAIWWSELEPLRDQQGDAVGDSPTRLVPLDLLGSGPRLVILR